MILCNYFVSFLIIIYSVNTVYGREDCTSKYYCESYCCSISPIMCCTSCASSIYYQSGCNSSISAIVGGIIAAIVFFIFLIVFIVSICCGYICSSRTGIQRRSRNIQTHQATVTVINPNLTTQDHIIYDPQIEIHYSQEPDPIAQSGTSAPPPYTESFNTKNPPEYNLAYLSDNM